ncbi:MAG: methionine biosynthesis protein MetW, partial [Planctomycetota bacterium]|jgi:SAM-dependent methyltransferase
LEKTASHDDIYDHEYYTDTVDKFMIVSCDHIADSIVCTFSPRSAVDLGCGTGLLLLALKEKGVECRGFEYSKAGIKICRDRGLCVEKLDLEKDGLPADVKADVAISTEVAEHLPEACSDRFVDMLCGIADTIVFTASEPTNTGTDHVNEQPKSYWIEKFDRQGFIYDENLTLNWRADWNCKSVASCYTVNLMLFRKK